MQVGKKRGRKKTWIIAGIMAGLLFIGALGSAVYFISAFKRGESGLNLPPKWADRVARLALNDQFAESMFNSMAIKFNNDPAMLKRNGNRKYTAFDMAMMLHNWFGDERMMNVIAQEFPWLSSSPASGPDKICFLKDATRIYFKNHDGELRVFFKKRMATDSITVEDLTANHYRRMDCN